MVLKNICRCLIGFGVWPTDPRHSIHDVTGDSCKTYLSDFSGNARFVSDFHSLELDLSGNYTKTATQIQSELSLTAVGLA